jgi:hypothetical protein
MKQLLALTDTPYGKAGDILDTGIVKSNGGLVKNLIRSGFCKPIETLERDGATWIRHDGGGCPVPGNWIVEAIVLDCEVERIAIHCAGWFSCSDVPGAVSYYRIISTETKSAKWFDAHPEDAVSDSFVIPDSLRDKEL